MARSRYPKPTEEQIIALREHCLKREAAGNKPGGRFTDNVDLRRGIIFYHSTAGEWYLYRDWRKAFNKMYPDYAVDEQSTLPERKPYVSRSDLEQLVSWVAEYDRDLVGVNYRWDMHKWSLYRREYHPWDDTSIIYEHRQYQNSIELYEELHEFYQAVRSACPECGCDWRLNPRRKGDDDKHYCPECGDTAENYHLLDVKYRREERRRAGITDDPMLGGQSGLSGREPMIGGKS